MLSAKHLRAAPAWLLGRFSASRRLALLSSGYSSCRCRDLADQTCKAKVAERPSRGGRDLGQYVITDNEGASEARRLPLRDESTLCQRPPLKTAAQHRHVAEFPRVKKDAGPDDHAAIPAPFNVYSVALTAERLLTLLALAFSAVSARTVFAFKYKLNPTREDILKQSFVVWTIIRVRFNLGEILVGFALRADNPFEWHDSPGPRLTLRTNLSITASTRVQAASRVHRGPRHCPSATTGAASAPLLMRTVSSGPALTA
jgi:hypothetical protein